MKYKYGWKYFWNKVLDKAYETFISEETSMQSVRTPFNYIEKAIHKFSSLVGNFLIFNLESAIYLVEEKKINPSNIVAWSDNNGKMALYAQLGIFKFLDNKDVFSAKHIYNVKTGEKSEMKFDRIIGNPPYDGSTHLKMLKCVESLLLNEGEIVWIHPARWIQDPLAHYKGNRSDFNKYKCLPFVENMIETIPRDEANIAFGINSDSDLMISYLNKKTGSSLKTTLNDVNVRTIVDKVFQKTETTIKSVLEKDKIDGIRVCIKSIVTIASSGGRNYQYKFSAFRIHDNYYAIDGFSDGKYWTDKLVKNQYSRNIGEPFPLSIKFNTEIEAQNFINCCNLEIYKFICIVSKVDMHIHHDYLPYMGDYTRPWTNEDLIKYFNLTEEEVDYIYKTLEKYS